MLYRWCIYFHSLLVFFQFAKEGYKSMIILSIFESEDTVRLNFEDRIRNMSRRKYGDQYLPFESVGHWRLVWWMYGLRIFIFRLTRLLLGIIMQLFFMLMLYALLIWKTTTFLTPHTFFIIWWMSRIQQRQGLISEWTVTVTFQLVRSQTTFVSVTKIQAYM